MSTNTPIVNAGVKYVQGLQSSSLDNNQLLSLQAGAARDSTNTNDIILPSSISINGGTIGANGCDSAVLANSTLYALYVIGDSTKYKNTAGLLSTNFTSPVLPFGYDMFRRVGWVYTGVTANIIPYQQHGYGQDKYTYLISPRSVLTGGNATSYTAVSLAPVGAIPTEVTFIAQYTPALAANQADLAPYSAAPVAATNIIQQTAITQGITSIIVPCSVDAGVAKISYKVTSSDSLSLSVAGYMDHIE